MRRGNTILLPISLIGGGLLAYHFGVLAGGAEAGSQERTAYILLCTLTLMGVFEHAMMMMPVRDGALWTWAFAVKDDDEAAAWTAGQARTGETG